MLPTKWLVCCCWAQLPFSSILTSARGAGTKTAVYLPHLVKVSWSSNETDTTVALLAQIQNPRPRD